MFKGRKYWLTKCVVMHDIIIIFLSKCWICISLVQSHPVPHQIAKMQPLWFRNGYITLDLSKGNFICFMCQVTLIEGKHLQEVRGNFMKFITVRVACKTLHFSCLSPERCPMPLTTEHLRKVFFSHSINHFVELTDFYVYLYL